MKYLHHVLSLTSYGLPLETIRLDFKSGLEGLLKKKPTKAIFIGTRIGDPNAVNLLLPCLVILQVFIDLLYAVLTPISAHNSPHLLVIQFGNIGWSRTIFS
jgi:hypothetical protein